MKDGNYDLERHEFFRYLHFRDYFMKEIRMDPSTEVKGVTKEIYNQETNSFK